MLKSLKIKLSPSGSKSSNGKGSVADDSGESTNSAAGNGSDGNDGTSEAGSEEPITVARPEDFDILFGRGKQSFNHVGNRRFRVFIGMHLRQYMDAPTRTEKTMVVNTVCEAILEAGGRFLKYDTRTKVYHVVNRKTARSKVGHALRDAVGTRVKLATVSTGGGSNSSSGERRQDFLGGISLGSTGTSDSFAPQQRTPVATLEPPQRPTLILPRTDEARFNACGDMMLGSSVARRDAELVSAIARRKALNSSVRGQVECHQLVHSLGLAPSNQIRHPIPIAPRLPPTAPSSMMQKMPPRGKPLLAHPLIRPGGSSNAAPEAKKGAAARLMRRVIGVNRGRPSSSKDEEQRVDAPSVEEKKVVSITNCPKDTDSIDSRVLDELDDAMSLSHGSSSASASYLSSSKKITTSSYSEGAPLMGLMGASNNSLRTRMDQDDPHNKFPNSNASVGSGDTGSQKKMTRSVMSNQSIASARDESVDVSEEFSVLSVDNRSAASTMNESKGARGPAASMLAASAASLCTDEELKTEASPPSQGPSTKTDASPLSLSSERTSHLRQQRNAQADQEIMELFRDDVVDSLSFGNSPNQLDLSGCSSESKFDGSGSAAGEMSLAEL